MRKFAYALLYVYVLCLLSCDNAGLQGTTLPSKFQGINTAVAISPTAVRLSWTLQGRFKEYRIYQKGLNSPIKIETFATTDITTNLIPGTTYEFSVTGVETSTEKEIGYDNFVAVTTYNNFTGISPAAATANVNGTVNVVWSNAGSNITYHVYAKREQDAWNLSNPISSVTGVSSANISGLSTGSKYCFWVVAKYLDLSSEPKNQSEAYINNRMSCALVQSQLSNLPRVSVNLAVVGTHPWFWTSQGDNSYKTEVFQKNTDILVGAVQGNGYFRAISPVNAGLQSLYAKVTSQDGRITIVDVQVEGLPTPQSQLLVRNLSSPTSVTPLYPRLIGGGLGMQRFGQVIKSGDFNCDGLTDVIIAAPQTTPVVTNGANEAGGSLVVYYSHLVPAYQDENGNLIDAYTTLKTDLEPSKDNVAPNPQIVYFGNVTNRTYLGEKMTIGNYNNDCFPRTQLLSEAQVVGNCDVLLNRPNTTPGYLDYVKGMKTCEDVAVSDDNGGVYVMYGDPLVGLVSGTGSVSYGLNERTCNDSSQKCRPVKHKVTDSTRVNSLGSGDYNNDGFDDLVMSLNVNESGIPRRHVYVLRGSSSGLVPAGADEAFAPLIFDRAGGTTPTGVNLTYHPDFTNTLNTVSNAQNVGNAVGSIYNSRTCQIVTGSTSYREHALNQSHGYDFTKCDDLVIGNPTRGSSGSIFVCKGEQPNTGDVRKITSWQCLETAPDTTVGASPDASHITVTGYGASIEGVPNQNGFPLTNIYSTSVPPNIAGALFVGAPTSTVSGAANAGVVFGYYMTPWSNGDTGGLAAIIGQNQSITAVNERACNSVNRDRTTGGMDHCHHQAIHLNPPLANSQFGTTISTLPDIQSLDRALPALAVSAPYRSVNGVNGHGTVYVYKPDTSTFGIDGTAQQSATKVGASSAANCTVNCTWFAGGINAYGRASMYQRGQNSSSYLGMGIAGGDFNGDSIGDLIVGSPYNSSKAYLNGEAYIFYSKGDFGVGVVDSDVQLRPNFSKEVNYRFHNAKVIGDVNGDGYDEVMTHITVANTTELILFYGSPNGLITSPSPTRSPLGPLDPVKVVFDDDPALGVEFYRVGSVNGDAYDDILILGGNSAYIYHGSSVGLVHSNAPTYAPVGQNPIAFARGRAGANITDRIRLGVERDSTLNVIMSSGGLISGIQNYESTNRGVTYGDFNHDGYSDIAIGLKGAKNPSGGASPYTATNIGRVMIVYGGASGIQVPRGDGFLLMSQFASNNPCNETTNICSPQIIAGPIVAAVNGVTFGWSLAGVPSIDKSAGDEFDELVVSDPGIVTNTGRVYLFKGSARGLEISPVQTISGLANNTFFGETVTSLGDINGDEISDVAVSSPGNRKFHVLYGGAVGASFGFLGSPTLGGNIFAGPLADNAPIDITDIKPQTISSTFNASEHFAFGIAGIGDINYDGYADILVNVLNKTYDLEGDLPQAGGFVIYFGSETGIQAQTSPSTTPICHGGTTKVCEPILIYLPNLAEYQSSFVSSTPAGDINGDGIADVLLGSPGRPHPSLRAFATGVVYVLY